MTESAITYDYDGNPVSIERWTELSLGIAGRVARTQLGHLDIVTFWTGINGLFHSGPPLIYETLVFNHGVLVDGPLRYATRLQARAAHKVIVQGLTEEGVR